MALTAAHAARVLDYLQHGASLRTAAANAGVPLHTLNRWLDMGTTVASGPYVEFAAAVYRILAEWAIKDAPNNAARKRKREAAQAWRLMTLAEKEAHLRLRTAPSTALEIEGYTVEGIMVDTGDEQ